MNRSPSASPAWASRSRLRRITTGPARPISPSTWHRPASSRSRTPPARRPARRSLSASLVWASRTRFPATTTVRARSNWRCTFPAWGAFYYRSDNGHGDVEIPIGTANSGDIPVLGDYDGSGRTEAAIYSPSGGYIEYAPANGGPDVTIDIGTANNGSIPVATPAGDLPEFAGPRSGSAIKAERGWCHRTPARWSRRTRSPFPRRRRCRAARPWPRSERRWRGVNQEGTDPLKFTT